MDCLTALFVPSDDESERADRALVAAALLADGLKALDDLRVIRAMLEAVFKKGCPHGG